jgi:predicted Zn finger-like uncharacterized protein
MDVRCEKCQTEYELDEARLKPGGVTVKCTNCGHMFKIRKRSSTHVGAPPLTEPAPARPQPSKPAGSRADSILGDETVVRPPDGSAEERQWLIRLENGEQKSCRELAALQQWIVAGVVTRESLISRSGKTWKRLGDITELAQYFTIADEARAKRQDRTTKPAGKPAKDVPGTMLGIGGVSAAGGTILPDDDDLEGRSTGNYKARGTTTPPPLPGSMSSRTPPMGSNTSDAEIPTQPRRPLTQPPPPPAKKQSQAGPLPSASPIVPPASNRSTGMWANDAMPTDHSEDQGPAGPLGGRIKATTNEPAFAGRVRVMPGDESAFTSGKVQALDDDDDAFPERRGGRSGVLLLLMALIVMGAAAGVIYVFVIKKDKATPQAAVTADAAVVATAADAATIVTPVIDTPPAPVLTALDTARAELGPDLELKLRDALKSLEGNPDPGVEALRAHLSASIAQGLTDRASITTDKTEGDKLKKDAKTIVLEAATAAQRAFKAAPDDAGANLAMGEVLRLQGKPARDIKRYLDTAKAKATPVWTRDIALADALVLMRDAKLDDAKAAFTAIDQGEGKLESTGDVRARFQLARIAYAQNKPTEARPLVDQVLAAQPEHAGAKALAARIETTVAKTDPLPPEDPKEPGTGAGSAKTPSGGGTTPVEGDSYDRLLAKANALAESNCTKAMDLFNKALEQKPNGVEALTGMGYCHIDAKQFASAFSKFRAALAVSSRYEPALWGVGEAYQQQGRKDQAIEAFKSYLEIYPGSAKAQKALDRLGGSSTPGPSETPGSGAPEPTPPPPAPDGAGSGSG